MSNTSQFVNPPTLAAAVNVAFVSTPSATPSASNTLPMYAVNGAVGTPTVSTVTATGAVGTGTASLPNTPTFTVLTTVLPGGAGVRRQFYSPVLTCAGTAFASGATIQWSFPTLGTTLKSAPVIAWGTNAGAQGSPGCAYVYNSAAINMTAAYSVSAPLGMPVGQSTSFVLDSIWAS